MFNTRIAISPSGIPHIGNSFVIIINYLLKNKIFGNFYLRIDNTNQKKNKIKNFFYILKNLKKNGIFFRSCYIQLKFINYYYKKKKNIKKVYFKKFFINNKIIKKNLNYSYNIFIKKIFVNFYDNNYGNLFFKLNYNNIIYIKNNSIPIYNFCSIIDDEYNNIFIILRGKEWLNQIPFQLLFNNKKYKHVVFNHLPNINNINNQKISKRNKKIFDYNIFIFLKKIKKIIKIKKNFKFFILEKKKKKINKINNYIMIHLFTLIKQYNFNNLFNFVNIKNVLINNLNFINLSNFSYFNKINNSIKKLILNNNLSLIIKKIKNYEFI